MTNRRSSQFSTILSGWASAVRRASLAALGPEGTATMTARLTSSCRRRRLLCHRLRRLLRRTHAADAVRMRLKMAFCLTERMALMAPQVGNRSKRKPLRHDRAAVAAAVTPPLTLRLPPEAFSSLAAPTPPQQHPPLPDSSSAPAENSDTSTPPPSERRLRTRRSKTPALCIATPTAAHRSSNGSRTLVPCLRHLPRGHSPWGAASTSRL